MKLVETKDKDSWNKYLGDYSDTSFQQSWEWGEFRQSIGYPVMRLGLFNTEDQPELLLSLESRRLPWPAGKVWYTSRGPIVKIENKRQDLIKEFVDSFTQKYSGTLLRVMPAWTEADDIDWSKLGFKVPAVLLHQHEVEATWLTSLEKSEEDLLASMHQKTRYNTKLASKKGVQVKVVQQSAAQLTSFYDLIQATGKRQKIKVFSKSYYEKLLSTASDDFKVEIFGADYDDKILATAMVIGFKNTLTYLYGGSSDQHKSLMAPYLLHWEVMKWGKEQGYKSYDWWGIEKSNDDTGSLSGVTRFKKGFGGSEFVFSGTHDYIYDSKKFKYLKLLKRVRDFF